MDINELDSDIQEHKARLGSLYSSVLETTLPFFIFEQRLQSGTAKIEEGRYRLASSEVDVLVTALVSGDEDYTITPTRLYEKLLFTSGAITKVLKKLEEKGYIERLDCEHDKRSRLVRLTPMGKETCENILSEVFAYQQSCFDVLSREEQESFRKILVKLARGMPGG